MTLEEAKNYLHENDIKCHGRRVVKIREVKVNGEEMYNQF